jgi:hypothetical protein
MNNIKTNGENNEHAQKPQTIEMKMNPQTQNHN